MTLAETVVAEPVVVPLASRVRDKVAIVVKILVLDDTGFCNVQPAVLPEVVVSVLPPSARVADCVVRILEQGTGCDSTEIISYGNNVDVHNTGDRLISRDNLGVRLALAGPGLMVKTPISPATTKVRIFFP